MLGDISGKYESGNRPGAVSSGQGDLGGISYGAHQFVAPVAGSFALWLTDKGVPYGGMLSRYEAGTPDFSDAWRDIARRDPEGFLKLQHEYTKQQYYDPALEYLARENYHADKHADALKECIFSRAVQYGAYWTPRLFEIALRRQNPAWLNLSYVDAPEFDRGMIETVYDFLIEECDGAYKLASGLYHSPDDWANGSYEVVKVGLRNRFVNERADLLGMLG